MLNIALAKGRVSEKVMEKLLEQGFEFEDYSVDSRKLIFDDKDETIRVFLVKSPDVPTYVENGRADIGIVGRDILLEHPAEVYEIANLNIGKCRMCVAGKDDLEISYDKKLVVATKYPNIAKTYFDSIDQPAKYIYLGGSVELAPLLGLSDCIVDIVESGSTLKNNDLEVYETILDISSRVIVNKVSFKLKTAEIKKLVETFEKL